MNHSWQRGCRASQKAYRTLVSTYSRLASCSSAKLRGFHKDFSCGDSSKLKQVNIFPLFNFCVKGNFLNRTENPFVNTGHWTIFRFYVECHVQSSFQTRHGCSNNLKSYIQVICCQFVLLIHILFENVILTFFYEPDSHSLGLLIPQCVPRITFLNAVS